MAEHSAIEWTDATVNFWWGCTKVGPGCDHCYAETWSKRTGESIWGVGAPRRPIKGAPALIAKLDAKAGDFERQHGRQRRVFIQSMSDFFDNEVPLDWFLEAWRCIESARELSIQIVTKRISIVEKRLAAIGRQNWPQHAGLMISVVNQEEADRDIPRLLALKAKLGIPWVGISAEPLLGPIDFNSKALWCIPDHDSGGKLPAMLALDWIIVGGESGPSARPLSIQWAREIRDQCAAAGTAFLFKQWGEWTPAHSRPSETPGRFAFGDYEFDRAKMVQTDRYPRQFTMFGARSVMERLGKKAAGRLLDGVTHDGFPRAL